MDRLDLDGVFSVIKDDLTPILTEALLPMLTIEDQAPKVKKAQMKIYFSCSSLNILCFYLRPCLVQTKN